MPLVAVSFSHFVTTLSALLLEDFPLKISHLAAIFAPVAFLTVAWLAPVEDRPGTAMTSAAKEFAASLDEGQKKQALFGFDSPKRTNWHFVPLQDDKRQPTRDGIRLELLTEAQREKALVLMRTGTSAEGAKAAETIMSLESVLHQMEGGKGNVRNPNWYFVSIYGEPGTDSWGWRFEGHHLSLNFTLKGDQVVSVTPSVFASNPTEIRSGPRKGQKTLAEVQDLALELIASLTPEQKEKANQAKAHPEVEAKTTGPAPSALVGIDSNQLTEIQKPMLNKLIQVYLRRYPDSLAGREWARIEKNPGALYFSYFRDEKKPGAPMTYRIARNDFQIEFLNMQADAEGNPANHIHSALRTLPKDFGLAK